MFDFADTAIDAADPAAAAAVRDQRWAEGWPDAMLEML